MNSKLVLDESQLHIFHEIRKRRVFVGELVYIKEKDQYELIYDEKYRNLKNAIAISPELNLFKIKHVSKKGKLFAAFQDRIPSRENPAYKDYCDLQGITLDESNPIILLCTIGKKGPSSLIFESVFKREFSVSCIKKFREKLGISQNDLALAFDIKKVTLQKIESEVSSDTNTIKLIQIYLDFPDVALWQLKQTGQRLHSNILSKLTHYFNERAL